VNSKEIRKKFEFICRKTKEMFNIMSDWRKSDGNTSRNSLWR